MHVVFTISSLGLGGAENVAVNMARFLVENGHEVTVVTIYGAGSDFFELPAGVRRIALELDADAGHAGHAVRNNWRRIRAIRRELRRLRPAVVVAHMTETIVLTVLAAAFLGTPVIALEQVDPDLMQTKSAWRVLRRATYRLAARLVVPSRGVYEKYGWLAEQHRTVIPNPMPDVPRPDERGAGARHTILGVGRLVHQKGFDILIDVFARLAPRHPRWDLEIIGDGELRGELEAQVARLGLGSRVRLVGAQKQPWTRPADVFAFPSRFEGLPGALIAAMASGLPAVSFDCPSGPAEIIRDGVDGFLIPPGDLAGFEAALDRLMGDADARREMGARATEARDRYHTDRIADRWEQLLQEVGAERAAV